MMPPIKKLAIQFGEPTYNYLIFNINLAILQSYSIPTNLTSPKMNSNSSFLLVNSEFCNETNLFGFTLYAVVNGSINIEVNN